MNRLQFKERKWKFLFFMLLSINVVLLVGLCSIGYTLFKPLPESELPNTRPSLERETIDSTFYVQTTKEQLSTVINDYMDGNGEQITILLDHYIELLTEIDVLGMQVMLHVQFEPIVEESGNLILRQHSLSFGLLQIPNNYALHYIGNVLQLPDWVYILPDEELIYLDIQRIPIGDTLQVYAEKFDLVNNDIEFSVTLIAP